MATEIYIHLVPKDSETPLFFASWTASSAIGAAIYNAIRPKYVKDSKDAEELTENKVRTIIGYLDNERQQCESRIQTLKEAYGALQLNQDLIDNYTYEYGDLKRELDNIKELIIKFDVILDLVNSVKYSDFQKILIETN